MDLSGLVSMSNRYGSNGDFVLAGGGNTSFKENGVMYVKGSGTSLGTIKAEQFVGMDMAKLAAMLQKEYPEADDAREAGALADMMAARLSGEENKRPSVEAILHAIFPQKYVLHTHPSLVNGLSCGKNGADMCTEIFGGKAVWIPLTKPGYILAVLCNKTFREVEEKQGKFPQIVILQNHGIFVAAETVEEIDTLMDEVMAGLKAKVTEQPDFSDVSFDESKVSEIEPKLRDLYSKDGSASAVFCTNKQVMEFVKDEASMKDLLSPFTPDHIVYCKHKPLFVSIGDDYAEKFKSYENEYGFAPKIAAVKGLGFFALGKTEKEAATAKILFLDAMKVAVYSRAFGGALPLPDDYTNFILNWEIESYRSKISQ